jgi:hypothetical protein
MEWCIWTKYRILKMKTFEQFNYNHIINVDIQPEYKNYINFNLSSWIDYLNNSDLNIIFLYNGNDTLGMITEYDYKDWLLDCGLNEDVLENATFFDKGYAFFRYLIDNGIDDEYTVELLKFMINNNIFDSRDMDEDIWNELIENNNKLNDIRNILENSDDNIYIPELINFLKNYNNIILTGGGKNECLKEVIIALDSLNKNYTLKDEFIY